MKVFHTLKCYKSTLILLGLMMTLSNPLRSQTLDDWMDISDRCIHDEQYDKAISIIHKALLTYPDEVELHYQLGWCYLQMEKHGDALVHMNKVLLYDTGFKVAHYYRGVIHHKMNQITMAEEDYQYYVKYEPDDTMVKLQLLMLYAEIGDTISAYKSLEICKLLINDKRFQRQYLTYWYMGKAYQILDLLSTAEFVLTTAIQLNMDFMWAYLQRAEVRIELQDYFEALFDLHIFTTQYPEHILARELRFTCLFNVGEFRSALQDVEFLIEQKKNDDLAVFHYSIEKANCLFKLEDYTGAILQYNKSLSIIGFTGLTSVHQENRNQLGWIFLMRGMSLHNLGMKKEACEDFQKSKQCHNNDGILMTRQFCD
jgi:tetratricopeptide (TPR) repeat protein